MPPPGNDLPNPDLEIPGDTRLARRRRVERVQARDYRNEGDWLLMFNDRRHQQGVVKPQQERGYLADMATGAVAGMDKAGESLAKFMGVHDELEALGQWINEKSGGKAPGSRTESLEAETLPGSLVEGFSQFLYLYGPLKVLGGAAGATGFGAELATGGIADMTAFDPEEGNLSTFAREMGVDNAFTQWLDSTEGSPAEGRLKNMIEGMLLTGAIDGAVKLFGHAMRGGLIGPQAGSRAAQHGMIAFHGGAGDIERFSTRNRGSLTRAKSARAATWLTSDPETAKTYAIYASEDGPILEALREADSFERIAQRTGEKKWWDKYDDALRRAESLDTPSSRLQRRKDSARVHEVEFPDDLNLMQIDAEGRTPQELSSDDIDSWLSEQIRLAKEGGFDGIKIDNLDDAINLSNRPATHYAIFDPNVLQVKGRE